MADDAPLDMEPAAPFGQASLARTSGERGSAAPPQTSEEWLSQRQQKEDEMITAILALLARKTAQAYVAAEDARRTAGQAA